MNSCTKRAYAKINLGLDVLGRFPNGYHEVKMVMQTVDIWDELTFEKIPREQLPPEQAAMGVWLTTDAGELPVDQDNLICRAVKLMRETYGFDGGIRINLKKNIPIAAGMAGGSTDAAATLKGVNELFQLGASEERLMELGVRIGADVPYCVMGGTALAEGIGEKLTRLSAAPQCVLLVVKPDLNVSTKDVYTALDALPDYAHPDIDGMVEAIQNGNLNGVISRLGNVLEPVTVEQCPAVAGIRKLMDTHGAKGSLMSGSGPTVFGIFDDIETAERAKEMICGDKACMVKQSFVTRFAE
ncbi:MAG: 4-(cytidine 5'-diphospho)-2-C-methyl-D-erythritol kinase [Lachnospiraceae bacterium]|nr:4-(cytidine 5'-diphospho)-2-C-methyl-D-erythritol kinase [Lachnospiraceae bacterium]MBQ8118447.1 4-(cytidine 5'-diphospho)-2-C-methyl-D-erythritol kinase [Lachnospiraceae bacterium]